MTEGQAVPSVTLPDLLRQPQAKLRALQDRLLRETVELCYRGHPFYQKLMKREGLEPRHIQTCDDLVRLPLSTKQDFLADPDAFRLQGDDLPVEAQTVWKMIYTTGTTSGRPAPIYVPSVDHYAFLYQCARRGELVDIRDTDTMMNLFPLTPFPMGAYARAADEVAAAGASIVYAHTGRPDGSFPLHNSLDRAVRMIERQRATILYGVSGFVRRVLLRAQELQADFRAVRMLMVTGEASSDAMLDDMRRRMRELGCADTKIVNRYGSTEQGASMAECQPGSGFHSLAPDQVFHEVVDGETGRRLADGETGMLAFTHVYRRGTVFLRYLVGDIVAMTNATCPHCGRTCPRITSQPVRSGDVLKIKGTLVNLQVLKDQLERLPAVEEYQIVIRPMDAADLFSMDELLVRVSARSNLHTATAKEIVDLVAKTAHVRPLVEFVERNDIFDPLATAKPRRVVDQRPSRT